MSLKINSSHRFGAKHMHFYYTERSLQLSDCYKLQNVINTDIDK